MTENISMTPLHYRPLSQNEVQKRVEMFPELSFISDPLIHDFATFCLARVPEYFFHIPASSTGKYHPQYALGEGGLVRHTRAAMLFLNTLTEDGFITYYQGDTPTALYGDDFKDAALLALLFHDSFKSGVPLDFLAKTLPEDQSHTVHEHPLLAAQFLEEMTTPFLAQINRLDGISSFVSITKAASVAITSHMGPWVLSKYSSVMLPSPANGDWLAKVVHLCDFVASRRYISFSFSTLPSNYTPELFTERNFLK